jgi:hypothetical protein
MAKLLVALAVGVVSCGGRRGAERPDPSRLGSEGDHPRPNLDGDAADREARRLGLASQRDTEGHVARASGLRRPASGRADGTVTTIRLIKR